MYCVDYRKWCHRKWSPERGCVLSWWVRWHRSEAEVGLVRHLTGNELKILQVYKIRVSTPFMTSSYDCSSQADLSGRLWDLFTRKAQGRADGRGFKEQGGGGLRYYGLQAKKQNSSSDRRLAERKVWQHSRPWCWHSIAMMLSQLLSWRWVRSAIIEPHLAPGAVRLTVQDGAQTSETCVGTHLHPVNGRLPRLDGTDVVCGFVWPPPPEVSQVREAQLLRLQRNKRTKIWL